MEIDPKKNFAKRSMGSVCSGRDGGSLGPWAGSTAENPFETRFTKKERLCLRETWQQLNDPKDIIGQIFVDILEANPEMKKSFGVDRSPRASMLKMPKLGGHVARITELLEQSVTFLGFYENMIGALQLVRKAGRFHTQQKFLEENHDREGSQNYFQVVAANFINLFIPYMTGEKKEDTKEEGKDAVDPRKKVRFAQNYPPEMITRCWERYFEVLTEQMTDAFVTESNKQTKAATQQALVPHQHAEEAVRKQKKIREKVVEQDTLTPNSSGENKMPEELFEDPF